LQQNSLGQNFGCPILPALFAERVGNQNANLLRRIGNFAFPCPALPEKTYSCGMSARKYLRTSTRGVLLSTSGSEPIAINPIAINANRVGNDNTG